MKQVLQDFKSGELKVEDVPRPAARPGFVLVENEYSLISSGTEGGTVKLGEMSLLQKARARPEQVKKVLKVIRTDGLLPAYQAVTRSLEMPIPLGYCCSGRVLEVGDGISDLRPGQRVACGGAGWANHAEMVAVPRNLVVAVPDEVSARHAAFTTLGSIAMQSLRVGKVSLGETVVVIGLGLVGLLVVQLLRAAGCRVFGIDLSEERVRFAVEQGFCQGSNRSAAGLAERVRGYAGGYGADAVIVTAATSNNDPVSLAGELARFKGRVVVVGRTEMKAPRETYLFKELELTTSLAYGPGTGDPTYEQHGLDYPIGYVRWTENRNMDAFVALVATEKLDLEGMISHEFDIERAGEAFDLVTGKTGKASLAVLLRYAESATRSQQRVLLKATEPKKESLVVNVVGAGSFAVNTFLPILSKAKGLSLSAISSANGVRARALGEKYGFAHCTSNSEEVLADAEADGVIILTRHDSHAAYTVAALRAGKHVFVEKPLALTHEELRSVTKEALDAGRLVQVGFNRRFAPLAIRLKELFTGRTQPMSISFRANVGYRPPEHWLHDPIEGGGVILGEAVHFVDFCQWLTGSTPVEVSGSCLNGAGSGLINLDNVHLELGFADGSQATVAYLSNGDPTTSRERVEVLCEGRLAVLEDFRRLELSHNGRRRRWRRLQDRGHAEQVRSLLDSWRTGQAVIPLEDLALSSLAALEAVTAVERRERRSIQREDAFG